MYLSGYTVFIFSKAKPKVFICVFNSCSCSDILIISEIICQKFYRAFLMQIMKSDFFSCQVIICGLLLCSHTALGSVLCWVWKGMILVFQHIILEI